MNRKFSYRQRRRCFNDGVSAMAADVGSVNSGFKTAWHFAMNHDAKGRTKDVVLEPERIQHTGTSLCRRSRITSTALERC